MQRLLEQFISSQVEWGACSLHRLVHAVTVIFFVLVASGPYKLALKVVNIAFVVEQVLLVVAFNLNSAEAFLGEIVGVVNIDHIVVFFALLAFAIHSNGNRLTILTKLLLCSLLLQSQNLALGEVLKIDLTIRKSIIVDELLLLLIAAIVCQLVDLILYQRILAGRIHQKFRVVMQRHVELALIYFIKSALLERLNLVLAIDFVLLSDEVVPDVVAEAVLVLGSDLAANLLECVA